MSATPVAFIGNPNCGKTTLFNALTGARQRVGNWPGVTVERKTGRYRWQGEQFEAIDLPGVYSLEEADAGGALDEEIARQYLVSGAARVVVNVVDASSLARGLFLTTQLIDLGHPVVVALNMMDVAERQGVAVDVEALAKALKRPVVALVAVRGRGLDALSAAVAEAAAADAIAAANTPATAPSVTGTDRFRRVDGLVARAVRDRSAGRRTATDWVDAVVMHRWLAFPVFLAAMYAMFMFSINIGSAFIDFFDIVGGALFVEGPRLLYAALGLPGWLIALLADGVGGGVQLVGTFVPVIGCLFLALSCLEDSGYMARVAVMLDRGMRRIGLPGKSFVPLIVGFGCNVPAVMATRSLDRAPDRILTAIMAPFMSCGARLTVYALFAAAFFPSNGQNIVFALYLIGIAVAVLSAFAVRRHLLKSPVSPFALELPPYHLPRPKSVLIHSWQRLKGFVARAGKAIVAVVVVLNVVSSLGTDGSVGNQNKESSVLAAIGKSITPAFAPMGIDRDNWPATVGIFTGIFAKEVVVGTLDALYAPSSGSDAEYDFGAQAAAAVASVGANLGALGETVLDPLGIDIGDVADAQAAAAEQGVEVGALGAMRDLFHGDLGAFSYLLFILLYMPCVATIGVIYKEIGAGWAAFSVGWSFVIAYAVAAGTYQIGSFPAHPASSAVSIAAVAAAAGAALYGLIVFGRQRLRPAEHIPVKQLV